MRKIRTILIAEDTEDDVLLLKRTLNKVGYNSADMHFVADGAEAINFLEGKEQYADRSKFQAPDFILTDLKMPKLGGLEMIRWVKQHPRYKTVPTVVLSSSGEKNDVQTAFAEGANGYLKKPNAFDKLQEMIARNFQFWEQNEFPQE